jgi:hypothetical protein
MSTEAVQFMRCGVNRRVLLADGISHMLWEILWAARQRLPGSAWLSAAQQCRDALQAMGAPTLSGKFSRGLSQSAEAPGLPGEKLSSHLAGSVPAMRAVIVATARSLPGVIEEVWRRSEREVAQVVHLYTH